MSQQYFNTRLCRILSPFEIETHLLKTDKGWSDGVRLSNRYYTFFSPTLLFPSTRQRISWNHFQTQTVKLLTPHPSNAIIPRTDCATRLWLNQLHYYNNRPDLIYPFAWLGLQVWQFTPIKVALIFNIFVPVCLNVN